MRRMALFEIGMASFLALLVTLYFGVPAYLAWTTDDWPVTKGTIVSSTTVRRGSVSRNISGYQIDAVYEYQVGGTLYEGARFEYYRTSTLETFAEGQRLKSYAPGASVKVHYDPDNPADAYLRRSFQYVTKDLHWVVIAWLLPIVGVIGAVRKAPTYVPRAVRRPAVKPPAKKDSAPQTKRDFKSPSSPVAMASLRSMDHLLLLEERQGAGKKLPACTEWHYYLSAYNQERRFCFHVFPETERTVASKEFGMQDIVIGFPPIDDLFILQSNDPRVFTGFLEIDPVRKALCNLHQVAGEKIEIWMDHYGLGVRCAMERLEGKKLEWFYQASVILTRFVLEHALGVSVVLDGEAVKVGLSSDDFSILLTEHVGTDEATVCRICGEDLTRGTVVRCSTCATPHHEDCWRYNGLCSIYGCGCRSFG